MLNIHRAIYAGHKGQDVRTCKLVKNVGSDDSWKLSERTVNNSAAKYVPLRSITSPLTASIPQMQAWYDGVIVKVERRSHIHLRGGTAGTYGECQCFYTIRFRPAIDTSKQEAPTFVKRIMGTRKLAFRSFARGSIFDIIAGRIRREDLEQSWRPEYRVDVSRFASDACITVPPRTSVRSREPRASPNSTGQPDSHLTTGAQESICTPQRTKSGRQEKESPATEWLRIKQRSWERAAARGATTDAGPGEAPHTVDALSSPGGMVDSYPGREGPRISEGGLVDDKDRNSFVSLPSPGTEPDSGTEWAKGFSETLSESERVSELEMTDATAHVDSILDSGVLEWGAGFGVLGMQSPDLDDDDFDIDVGTEVVGGVQGLGGALASEGCQPATWLRYESESADERQLSPLEEEPALSREGEKRIGKGAARKRKFDEKKTEGSQKRDTKAVSSAGFQPDLVLSGDKWAELEEMEERAEAAQRKDAGAGVQGSGRRSLRLLTGLSTQLGGGKTRGSHALKERMAKREDQDKIGQAREKDQNKVRKTKKRSRTGGKGEAGSKNRKAPEKNGLKEEYVWSSEDEGAAKPRASGSEGNEYQDAITTAWEQLQGYNADQIMKGALTKETKEEPGLKGLGRDCERQSHPLRQESDGMYCATCRCFVRQLTETDLRPAQPATGNGACFEQASVEKKSSKQLRKKGVGKKRLKRFEGEPNAALKGEETAGKKAEESPETPESSIVHTGEKYLREQMLRHQKDALEFITRALVGDAESARKEGGAILWHSPGLGKTLVVSLVLSANYRDACTRPL
jgi:hypothetical protein